MGEKSREAVKIPVFASLNAVDPETWVDYAGSLPTRGSTGWS